MGTGAAQSPSPGSVPIVSSRSRSRSSSSSSSSRSATNVNTDRNRHHRSGVASGARLGPGVTPARTRINTPAAPPQPPPPLSTPGRAAGEGSGGSGFRHQAIRIQEPLERRPLLAQRAAFPHSLDGEVYSCYGSVSSGSCNNAATNSAHRALPVYTNIHRIRRDIISVVEDYLSLDQLRDVRLNVSVIRPLVDKLYEQDDISIVYCLLVNRAQFLSEQSHLSNRQNVNFTRAMLCELIATRILRRFNEDNEGPRNLLVLAHILIAGFEPFQNAPAQIREEVGASTAHHRTLPALEVAILSESRVFLASTTCQKMWVSSLFALRWY